MNATSHGAITDIIHNGDDCVVARDTHVAGEQRFVCELLPLTHAIARIDIRDGDDGNDDGGDIVDDVVDQVNAQRAEIGTQNSHLIPLSTENDSGCVANKIEAHASVHPWLPETYDYTLWIEVDGDKDYGRTDDLEPTGSRTYEKTDVSFSSEITVHAQVENKYATGQDLYNDGETRVSLPDDDASAELTFTCGTTSWRTNCDIDGELEEHNPPSRF